MLGVSFDNVEDNAAFAEKFSLDYPLLCDTERTLGLAYGAADDTMAQYAKRISYLIGKDGRIRKAYPKVSAGEHPDEVLKDLETA